MTPEERERAEELAVRLGLVNGTTGAVELCNVDDIVAYAREERARVWEEAADRVGPHDDLYFEWWLKAKMLREEGGNHVQDRRTRENRRVRL